MFRKTAKPLLEINVKTLEKNNLVGSGDRKGTVAHGYQSRWSGSQ